jgi:hypothetical protein
MHIISVVVAMSIYLPIYLALYDWEDCGSSQHGQKCYQDPISANKVGMVEYTCNSD